MLPTPSTLGLPYSRWRPHQADAVLAAFDSVTPATALQLPTGTGKSAVAVALAMLSDVPTVILTATKLLQDQYADVFGGLVTDIRGMGNYRCLEQPAPGTCDTGHCRVKMPCALQRGGCLFFDAHRAACRAPIIVTSYATWIANIRHLDGIGTRRLVILDEAHDAPTQLSDNLHTSLHQGEIPLPKPKAGRLSHGQWRYWAARQWNIMEERGADLDLDSRLALKSLCDKLDTVAGMGDDWVIAPRGHQVEFAPTLVDSYAKPYLWGKAKVVLLSATVTPRTLAMLGIPPKDQTWVTTPSPFPVERRPVWCYSDRPRLRIDHRMPPEIRDEWLYQMEVFCAARRDRKGIIHTVSYKRQQEIVNGLRQLKAHGMWFVAPRKAADTAQAVADFRRAKPGAILIGPAFMTGYDFPGRDCEYQIISKVPFPDTRSPITKARAAQDTDHYAHETMQLLVQAVGRGMRAVGDRCETLVIDDHIHWFLHKYRGFAPDWFLSAVQRVTRMPDPAPRLTDRHPEEE